MNLPAWVLPYKEPKTEIKRINGHFYKYAVEYRYNAAKKRTDKVSSRLLGRLSETDGFIPSVRQSTATDQVDLRKVDIKTFGIFGLFRSLLGEEINGILSLFSREVSEILLIVALYRFAHQSAIKRMPHYHSTDYSSEHWSKTGLNAKNITQALRKVGENREIIVNWMQKRIASPSASLSNFLMIDSTHIPTVSENLHINAAGYNPQSSFDKQIRLMYIFSSELKQPVYYRLINGNIAEISSMKACVEELNVRPVVFVADKGFYSKNNTNTLRKNKLHLRLEFRGYQYTPPRNFSWHGGLLVVEYIELRVAPDFYCAKMRHRKYRGRCFLPIFRPYGSTTSRPYGTPENNGPKPDCRIKSLFQLSSDENCPTNKGVLKYCIFFNAIIWFAPKTPGPFAFYLY